MKDKLNKIQSELKAPKAQFNKFGNYKYRNAEDILESVKPLLSKHGCVLLLADEVVNIGDRFYVKATATIADIKTEASISVTALAREEESKKGMDGSQITGASSSYARKYALNGLFLIDDTKDSDTTNTHDDEEKKGAKYKKSVKVDVEQYKTEEIKEMLKDCHTQKEVIDLWWAMTEKQQDELRSEFGIRKQQLKDEGVYA